MNSENKDYDLWWAEFGVQRIQEQASRLEQGMDKLKARAASLLGWVVSLSVVSIASFWASAMRYDLVLTIITMLTTLSLITSSLLCVLVLYPIKWKFLEYNLDDVAEFHTDSKVDTLKSLMYTIDVANKENIIYYKKTSLLLRISWITFSLAPFVLLLGGLFALYLNL